MKEFDDEFYCASCNALMTLHEYEEIGQCQKCEDEEASQYYAQEAMEDYRL